MSNTFYCYSKRLFHFIKAFGIDYSYIGINKNTRQRYYAFNILLKLDKILQFYNTVKPSLHEVERNDNIGTKNNSPRICYSNSWFSSRN